MGYKKSLTNKINMKKEKFMKRKLLLFLTVITVLVLAFAVSVSAEGSTSDAYGTVTEIEGEVLPTVIDSEARVVIVASDGTYYTFPAYYIISDNAKFTWRKNDSVNQLLGYNLSANDMRTKVIRMELPEGITSINPNNDGGATVFEDAKLMLEIKLPSTLTKIGSHVFNRCYKLSVIDGLLEYLAKETTTTLGHQMVAETLWGEGVDLVIPKNVTSIPERCFYGTKIKSVTFHDDITYIGPRSFQSCANLTSVKLPSGLQKMENHVFASCTKLASVDVSACTKLEKIGNYCFEYDVITSFDFTPFAGQLTNLGDGVFNQCKKLTTVTGYELVDMVTSIGQNMFNQCPLTALSFPKNITSIGSYAFFGHKSQQSVLKIPNGVTTIGDHAFVRDRNVPKIDGTVEIYLPASLTGFTGSYNFEYWDFDVMYIPSGLTIAQGVVNGTLDKGVVYYYTGAKDSLTIHGTNNSALLNAEWISADEFSSASADKNYIVYGYNKCDAFYNSEHLTAEQTYDFTSFTEKSYVKSICSRCNQGTILKEVAPLFTCLGYSAYENGTGGIAIGFIVDNIAIAEYEELTGKTLKYGVFAVSQKKLGNAEIFGENGATSGVVVADVTSHGFSVFELKVVGFNEESIDTKLAIGAYVATTDGEATKYSYIQSGTPDENEKYCFVSYNDIIKQK